MTLIDSIIWEILMLKEYLRECDERNIKILDQVGIRQGTNVREL